MSYVRFWSVSVRVSRKPLPDSEEEEYRRRGFRDTLTETIKKHTYDIHEHEVWVET